MKNGETVKNTRTSEEQVRRKGDGKEGNEEENT
jgi:hypothetical protein